MAATAKGATRKSGAMKKGRIKRGDSVIVIAGNDKGRVGEVQEILRERNRIVVDGVNLRWKHTKPTQQSPKGERVQKACSIHASNVLFYDANTEKGVRKRSKKDA